MQITLTFPDLKVPAMAAACNNYMPRLGPEDNDGREETDKKLIERCTVNMLRALDQNYRQRKVSTLPQDADIVDATDTTP